MSDLKPCPFCGGESMLVNTVALAERCKSVMCMRCKAKVNNFSSYSDERSAELAIEAWNRRVEDG